MRGAPPMRRWAITAAPFWRRLVADALDALLGGCFVVAAWRSALIAEPLPDGQGDLLDRLADLAATELILFAPATTAAMAAALLYGVATRALLGGTLGERAVGLRLVGPDGTPCGPVRALVHGIGAIVGCLPLGLGYTWALLDRERRTLAEHLSGARLIVGIPRPSGTPRGPVPAPR